MSLVILSTVVSSSWSGITLRNKQYTDMTFREQRAPVYSPDFLLSLPLLPYQRRTVNIKLLFANTIEQAAEQAKKGKGKIFNGVLKVEHSEKDIDINRWFQSSVAINGVDFSDLFEGKEGKAVWIEIK